MKNQRIATCDCGSTDVREVGKGQGVYQCLECGDWFDEALDARPEPRRMKREYDEE